jgi:hypothetical protein
MEDRLLFSINHGGIILEEINLLILWYRLHALVVAHEAAAKMRLTH